MCEWVSSGIFGNIALSELLGNNLISACSCRNELKCSDSLHLICSQVPERNAPESNPNLMDNSLRFWSSRVIWIAESSLKFISSRKIGKRARAGRAISDIIPYCSIYTTE